MRYAVDWTHFSKADYEKLIREKKSDTCEDIFYGRIYVGQLCFDVNTFDGDSGISLDCYVPFEKGYGDKELEDGTIIDYDYADGLFIGGLDRTYEEFAKIANAAMEDFIREEGADAHSYSLVEKAKKDIIYW